MANISSIRTDYQLSTLEEENISSNPFLQFEKWWQDAEQKPIEEPNAMTLCTINKNTMMPNARIVLLKDFSEKGFTFFTNYESEKGNEIDANPQVCLLFFWKELQRQVKIQGSIEKISDEESTKYFTSRPLGSKLAAWASQQSKPLEQRKILEERYKKKEAEFGLEIPKPPYWGGYLVNPQKIEFWQGRQSRLHDRIVYEKTTNAWVKYRLNP